MRATDKSSPPVGVNEMMAGHQLGPQEEEDANQVRKTSQKSWCGHITKATLPQGLTATKKHEEKGRWPGQRETKGQRTLWTERQLSEPLLTSWSREKEPSERTRNCLLDWWRKKAKCTEHSESSSIRDSCPYPQSWRRGLQSRGAIWLQHSPLLYCTLAQNLDS